MELSTTITNSPEKNRDSARINRPTCEVKGTLHMNMGMKAHLLMSTLIQEAKNASQNTMKWWKLIEIADIIDDL